MNSKTNPAISVILPVYNAEKYLRDSIASILAQHFDNFELIVLNDGSTDDSEKIISSFHDDRIVYVRHANRGLAATINRGILLARGKYIARQDNDDISVPQRFAEQYNFLESHPDIALLGCSAVIIDENGKTTGRFHDHPTSEIQLRYALLFNNPFVHSSVMIRKSVFEKSGGYSEDPNLFEDYEMWSRIARVSGIANLPSRLLQYREVASGMSKSSTDYRERVIRQCYINLQQFLPDTTVQEVMLLAELCHFSKNGFTRKELLSALVTLKKASIEFCATNKVRFSEIREQYNERVFRLRRVYYNSIIEDPKSGTMKQTLARVSRRLLFTFHKPSRHNENPALR